MWFNNVETKPGMGYPKRWEDQEQYKGGWQMRKGKLELKSGSKLSKIAMGGKIFYNPDMPEMKDYYEPWTYNYEHLTTSEEKKHQLLRDLIQQSLVRKWRSNGGGQTGRMI